MPNTLTNRFRDPPQTRFPVPVRQFRSTPGGVVGEAENVRKVASVERERPNRGAREGKSWRDCDGSFPIGIQLEMPCFGVILPIVKQCGDLSVKSGGGEVWERTRLFPSWRPRMFWAFAGHLLSRCKQIRLTLPIGPTPSRMGHGAAQNHPSQASIRPAPVHPGVRNGHGPRAAAAPGADIRRREPYIGRTKRGAEPWITR